MTPKEAIEIRKNPTIKDVDNEELSKCIDEALEKQIPKKPILDTIFPSGIKWFRCPICNQKIVSRLDGEWIAGRPQKYCDNCGQALDWSE